MNDSLEDFVDSGCESVIALVTVNREGVGCGGGDGSR